VMPSTSPRRRGPVATREHPANSSAAAHRFIAVSLPLDGDHRAHPHPGTERAGAETTAFPRAAESGCAGSLTACARPGAAAVNHHTMRLQPWASRPTFACTDTCRWASIRFTARRHG
jgi:hypothetical protein